MNNGAVIIPEKILNEFDSLVKKSGVSEQEFLTYISKLYNTNNNIENDKIDFESYYNSFIA